MKTSFSRRGRSASEPLCWLLLAALGLLLVGCKSASGSREYIPGKGWRATQLPAAPAVSVSAEQAAVREG